MVTFQSVKSGIEHYLDQELLNKVSGWQRWVIGAGMEMYLDKGVDIFNILKTQPVVQALNVIDTNDNIDIDTIYNHMLNQARHGAVSFRLPLMGDITLTADDVEKMYHCILNA